MTFSPEAIRIDPAAETERIVSGLRQAVRATLRRSGGVVGVSGGVDSAVVLALCVRAFGAGKVVPLILPERDSDPQSARLGHEVAARFGVTPIVEDLTTALEGLRCYERRDDAVKRVFPEYEGRSGYRMKIGLPPNALEKDGFNAFVLTIVRPDGSESAKPLPASEFLQIVAASNLKQRSRMEMLYYHAELRNYAVVGTTNKDEHDQGFFVKYGDGGADVMAIGHLFKLQVYQLAEYLGVPDAIRERPPTTDTYSAPCDQTEFFFRLPFRQLDVLWHAWEHQQPPEDVATAMGLTPSQVELAYADFGRKTRATEYLRRPPIYLT